MVIGCKFGECDFETGNYTAKRHVEFAKRVLDRIGVGGNRVDMFLLSAAESDKLIAAVNEMIRRIEAMPLNPLK
jgi:F420-non-reducing hydrogenase iron-sulfur subunit